MWLVIRLKKTEVVNFYGPTRRVRRRAPKVRIGADILPRVSSFKYLGVTISEKWQITMHQKAVFLRAKVSAHEVAKLVCRLDVTNMERLTTYLHSFVDGQFYGV
jgi:hypothetical protein